MANLILTWTSCTLKTEERRITAFEETNKTLEKDNDKTRVGLDLIFRLQEHLRDPNRSYSEYPSSCDSEM